MFMIVAKSLVEYNHKYGERKDSSLKPKTKSRPR